MSTSLVFGAIALDDHSSLRVGDLQTVLLLHLFSSLIVACAEDVKLRSKVPFADSDDGIARFSHVVSTVACAKKTISLIATTGSDAATKRFEAQASQGLARVVSRFPDLGIVVGMAPVIAPMAVAATATAFTSAPTSPRFSPRSSKAKAAATTAAPQAPAAAPLASGQGPARAPLDIWVSRAAELILTVLVESVMSLWQRPATMAAAEKLSLENAQAQLRRDLTDDDMAVCAGLVVMKRSGDFALAYKALPSPLRSLTFATDLLAHLSPALKAKVALFDEAAAIAVPPGESFLLRLASPAGQAACTAQLGSWALAAKTDKANLVKAVQMQVAVLGIHRPVAGVPPPAQAPASGSRRGGGAMSCLCCEKADRPAAGHTRETCEYYKCHGCGCFAPGHIWRTCPNPSVGGPCPPHVPRS